MRISQYPTGPGLFRDVACTVGAGEQFDTFYSAARELHDLVSNGDLRGNVSCRQCWINAGASLPRNGRKNHKYYVDLGCVCTEYPKKRK